MMWRITGVLLGLQLGVLPVSAADYVCAADQTLGFFFNRATNGWQPDTFDVRDEKYALTTEGGKRVWKKLGDPLSKMRCRESEVFIECDVVMMRVSMNKNNLRYQIIYEVGYIEGIDLPEDTPFIQIGRCSSM